VNPHLGVELWNSLMPLLGECRTLWGEREQAMCLGVELFCS